MMNPLGTTKKCPACGDEFRGFIQGSIGAVCPTCRRDFGINTDKDAQELIAIFDDLPKEGRDQAIQLAKASRKQKSGREQAALPAPKVDPLKVAEAVRTMTTYGLTTPLPEQLPTQTNYVVAKNGLFEVRENAIARILFQPKEILGLTEELTTGVTLRIPMIPYEMLTQTVAFFRAVCAEAKGSSEAIVRIWWNQQEKAYEIRVPDGDQQVSGGSVRHFDTYDLDDARDAEGRSIRIHVMDIHSHGSSMNAFWSGVDDSDERKAPEGRMFGVIGKVLQPLPEWKWRMRTREGFIDLNVADIFDMKSVPIVPFTVSMDVILRVASTPDAVKDGMLTLKCPVNPFEGGTFPQEWMEHVKMGWQGGAGRQWGFRGRHGGGMDGVDLGSRSMSQYIYIKDKSGRLEEFEYDGTVTKSTGHYLELGKIIVH